MEEEWRSVVDYEGLYAVSNWGSVKSIDRIIQVCNKKKGFNYYQSKPETVLYRKVNRGGYIAVRMSKNNCGKHYLVHRLVAIAFIPNPNNYPEVNHIDGDKTNNNVSNLEWCNQSQNTYHSYRIGKQIGLIGEKNHFSTIQNNDAILIMDKFKMGYSISEIQSEFGYSYNVIQPITVGKTWKHLFIKQ